MVGRGCRGWCGWAQQVTQGAWWALTRIHLWLRLIFRVMTEFWFCCSLARIKKKLAGGNSIEDKTVLLPTSPWLPAPEWGCRGGRAQPACHSSGESPLNESDSWANEYVCKKTTQHLNLTPTKGSISLGQPSLLASATLPLMYLLFKCVYLAPSTAQSPNTLRDLKEGARHCWIH